MDPQVGQLYEGSRGYLPKFAQPSGPGTAAFPAQSTGELIGMWMAGCGHSFQNWAVYSDTVGGVRSALMCCPYCGYLQRIMTPYDTIYSQFNDVLFA